MTQDHLKYTRAASGMGNIRQITQTVKGKTAILRYSIPIHYGSGASIRQNHKEKPFLRATQKSNFFEVEIRE